MYSLLFLTTFLIITSIIFALSMIGSEMNRYFVFNPKKLFRFILVFIFRRKSAGVFPVSPFPCAINAGTQICDIAAAFIKFSKKYILPCISQTLIETLAIAGRRHCLIIQVCTLPIFATHNRRKSD